MRTDLNKRLLSAMTDPEQVLFQNDSLVVLVDRYPKSKWHYLVIPWKDIPTITEVTKEDLELLKTMEILGLEIARKNSGEEFFRVGYHAEPTMYRLHLHILTRDLCGSGIDSVRHWNSFTTPFFVESSRAIGELEHYGRINLPSKEECKMYLNIPLKCHKCSYFPENLMDLKDHLTLH